MAIFQRGSVITGITDQMTLHGYNFEAILVVNEKSGNAAAIHRGRILLFQLICEGETIAYFDSGTWYQLPDEDFEEGLLAKELLVSKWSKGETIRDYIQNEIGGKRDFE